MGLPPTEVDDEPDRIFRGWLEQFFPRIGKVLIIEQPLLHKGAFYCGTPDLVAEVDGIMTLVDWKTCQPGKARVRQDWLLQQGAYASAIYSCYGIELHRGMNVMLWDGGLSVQAWNRADLLQGWAKFAGYLMEHHAREAQMGSKVNHAALCAMEPMFTGGH